MNNIKIRSLLRIVLISLIWMGCVKEINHVDKEQENLHEVVFHAGWDAGTKTVLQEDGRVYWEPYDRISVFFEGEPRPQGSLGYVLTSTNGDPAATTDFVGQIGEKKSGASYVAVHPWPNRQFDYSHEDWDGSSLNTTVYSIQSAVPGTFSSGAFVSVARSKDENLYFRNVCSGIKFSVSNSGIKKVKFTPYSNDAEESLSGDCCISFDDNGDPYISSHISTVRSVTIEAPSGEYLIPGQNYYASILPGTFSEGLRIEYFKDDGIATYHLDKEIIAKKNVFGRIGPLDKDLEFTPIPTTVELPYAEELWKYLGNSVVKKIRFVNNSNVVTSNIVADNIYFEYSDETAIFYTSADAFKLNKTPYFVLFGSMINRDIIEEIDLGAFDLSELRNLNNMFAEMTSLKKVDMSEVITTGVQNMAELFCGCTNLEAVDLSGLNTSNVTSMRGMFGRCSSLKSIDLSSFDTSNVTEFGMFGGCSSLESIDVSSFNTSKAESLEAMFSGCSSLKSIDVSTFNTSNVTDMHSMFDGCSSLTTLDLSSFDTSNNTNFSGMFCGCTNLKSLDIHSFNTNKATRTLSMFKNCIALESLDISQFDVSHVWDFGNMFAFCRNMKDLNLGRFEISQSADWMGCFYYMAASSRNCNVTCERESLEYIYHNPYDPTYFGSSKKYINWYCPGETTPVYNSVRFPDLYQSTDYSKEGTVKVLQRASVGNGIDVVMMGDGFSDRLINDGTYDRSMQTVMDALFVKEPFASYRDMFNIYEVVAVSENETLEGNTRFDCEYDGGDHFLMREYAAKAVGRSIDQIADVVIVIVCNKENMRDVAYLDGPADSYITDYGTGVSRMYISIDSDEAVINHEWGHAFAKLGDEYDSVYNPEPYEISNFNFFCTGGYYKNIDTVSSLTDVKWSKFINDPRYSTSGLGAFEGAFVFATGFYRPTDNSIMNESHNGVLGFNAPSREAIYYRIHKLAYGKDWQYDYETFVQQDLKNISSATSTASVKSVPYPARVNGKPLFKMEESTTSDGKKIITMIMD